MRDSAGRKVISQRVTLHVVFRSDYAAESLLAARLCLIRDKHDNLKIAMRHKIFRDIEAWGLEITS
jgi:hypothetical protein